MAGATTGAPACYCKWLVPQLVLLLAAAKALCCRRCSAAGSGHHFLCCCSGLHLDPRALCKPAGSGHWLPVFLFVWAAVAAACCSLAFSTGPVCQTMDDQFVYIKG
eukprot:1154028-Pelagomonas_calceolata.AAC.17